MARVRSSRPDVYALSHDDLVNWYCLADIELIVVVRDVIKIN